MAEGNNNKWSCKNLKITISHGVDDTLSVPYSISNIKSCYDLIVHFIAILDDLIQESL